MIYFCILTSNILFSIFSILLSPLHNFICILHTFAVIYSLCCPFQFLHIFYILLRGAPKIWQLWHLGGFGKYISTLVIVYPIFISIGGFGVLKLRIYIFVRIIWLFFLMDILWASVIPFLQRLCGDKNKGHRKRSNLPLFSHLQCLVWGRPFFMTL